MTAISIKLPTVVDTASVAALRTQIADRRGQVFDLDAGGVERIGGLGLQVVLSALRTWAADGVPMAVTNPSPAFREMLRATGSANLVEIAE